MTRNHCVELSYAWLVAIGCLISRAGKPHGSLVYFVFGNIFKLSLEKSSKINYKK
jgi:hypothetical protein